MAGSPASRRPVINGWTPRGLPLTATALYVGLGKSTWLELVEKGDAPEGVFLTPGRKVWLREDLDAWLDERAAREQNRKRTNTWEDFEP
ncbi:hypothetical protein GCM10009416_13090 [Craurococcus roseus]|uniref:DNA-binding protein n=1 Tax=Craurococcus roseus TaxID=77585 RepID=A0ABN1EVP8_9PROT